VLSADNVGVEFIWKAAKMLGNLSTAIDTKPAGRRDGPAFCQA
jgi:hypothetical protein